MKIYIAGYDFSKYNSISPESTLIDIGTFEWSDIDHWLFIVNDIRYFVFGFAKAHIYGFGKAGNRNLLCRLL